MQIKLIQDTSELQKVLIYKAGGKYKPQNIVY